MTKHVFRITAKYWVHEERFVLVFLSLDGVAMYWLDDPKTALLCGLVVLVGLLLILLVGKEWRARVEIDEQSLTWCDGKTTQVIRWDEVLFAKLIKSYHRPRKVLELAYRDAGELKVWAIKLDYYNHQRIWQLAQQHLPPSSLAEAAEYKTPEYQAWALEATEAVKQLEQPVQANDWRVFRLAAWGIVLFTVGSAVISATSGQVVDAVLTAGVAVFFGAWLFLIGRIEADRESLTLKTPLHVFRIRWDEITAAESTPHGSIVFYGNGKYLRIPSPDLWTTLDRTQMIGFLSTQIELRQIPVKPIRFSFKFARNTKVK